MPTVRLSQTRSIAPCAAPSPARCGQGRDGLGVCRTRVCQIRAPEVVRLRRLPIGVLACILLASWAAAPGGLAAGYGPQHTVVTAPDPSTVVVALPKPFSPGAFLSIMANPVAGIVDSATVKAHVVNNDWGNGWLTDHSAGSGPFQLARWERQVAIELVENPRYNLGPAPQVKRIIFPNILENTVQREML